MKQEDRLMKISLSHLSQIPGGLYFAHMHIASVLLGFQNTLPHQANYLESGVASYRSVP